MKLNKEIAETIYSGLTGIALGAIGLELIEEEGVGITVKALRRNPAILFFRFDGMVFENGKLIADIYINGKGKF